MICAFLAKKNWHWLFHEDGVWITGPVFVGPAIVKTGCAAGVF